MGEEFLVTGGENRNPSRKGEEKIVLGGLETKLLFNHFINCRVTRKEGAFYGRWEGGTSKV